MILLLWACQAAPVDVERAAEAPATVPAVKPGAGVLTEVFAPPAGFQRVEADPFGTWLRDRTVTDASRGVKTHDGRAVPHRARVIDMPLVPGDLQQCADSVLRLRAEWLLESGAPVSFHATSGDPLPWAKWQAGERPVERNNRIAWVPGTEGGWDRYLAKVFNWAGTRSLHAYDTVPAAGPPRVGDVLVAPGSPGHAVILLDVAQKDEAYVVLVGEGYMPAQDFHVELGPKDGWWPWGPGVALDHWDLSADPAKPGDVHRRFR